MRLHVRKCRDKEMSALLFLKGHTMEAEKSTLPADNADVKSMQGMQRGEQRVTTHIAV